MSFGDYLENEVLDHIFGGADYARPATLYVALSTANPGEDGSGLAEPSGGSYARVAVTNNATNFPAAAGGSKSNGSDLTFPEATAAWGTITYFAIFDAASGGNMLLYGALSSSKVVDIGDTLKFVTGDLTITLT